MPITLTDIARRAKVSQGTVSRVINGGQIRVKPKTREKILQIAKELNYIPNISAQTLKTGKTFNIAVVAYDITDAFAVECVRTMEEYLGNTDYKATWVSCSNKQKSKPQKFLNEIAHHNDGVIVIAAHNYLTDANLLQLWATQKTPIVSVIRRLPGDLVPSVRMNNDIGMRLAMNHLYELGHRKIAICHDKIMHPAASQRYKTYKAYLKEHDLPDNISWQYAMDNIDMDSGYRAGIEFLKEQTLPTAVVAFNDLSAFGLIIAFTENGLKVPDDISIASFDNIRMSKYYNPSLTTVAADYKKIAQLSIDKLTTLIDAPDLIGRESENIILKPELIIRNSTAKARQ